MMPHSLASLAVFTNYSLLRVLFNAASEVITAILLAASIAFLHYTVFSKSSGKVWNWFINKLSENGYV